MTESRTGVRTHTRTHARTHALTHIHTHTRTQRTQYVVLFLSSLRKTPVSVSEIQTQGAQCGSGRLFSNVGVTKGTVGSPTTTHKRSVRKNPVHRTYTPPGSYSRGVVSFSQNLSAFHRTFILLVDFQQLTRLLRSERLPVIYRPVRGRRGQLASLAETR